MLKFSELKSPRLRKTVTIQGHEVTFGLRGPNSIELMEASRSAAKARDAMEAAKAAGSTHVPASEMVVTIDTLSELVVDVDGVDVVWGDLSQMDRRELLAAIPIHQFWDVYNEVMSLDTLKAEEKNG